MLFGRRKNDTVESLHSHVREILSCYPALSAQDQQDIADQIILLVQERASVMVTRSVQNNVYGTVTGNLSQSGDRGGVQF